MNKKTKIPQIKKDLWSFLNNEEGKIIKKNALKVGISVAILGLIADRAAAQHNNCWQQNHSSHSSGCPTDYNTNFGSEIPCDCPSNYTGYCPSYGGCPDVPCPTNYGPDYHPDYTNYAIVCPTGHFVAVCPSDCPIVHISVETIVNPACPQDYLTFECNQACLAECPIYCSTNFPGYCAVDYPYNYPWYCYSECPTYCSTDCPSDCPGNFTNYCPANCPSDFDYNYSWDCSYDYSYYCSDCSYDYSGYCPSDLSYTPCDSSCDVPPCDWSCWWYW